MKPIIIVADSTRARVFTTGESSSELNELEVLAHPEGRMHDRDISSDLPGKDAGAGGGGAHAYADRTEPREYEVKVFAKRVANYLDDARKANKLSRLLLIAAPGFLGELRAQMNSETSEKIVFELDKNLTHHSVEEVREHLPRPFNH